MSTKTTEREDDIFKRIQSFHYKNEYSIEEFVQFRDLAAELVRLTEEHYTFFILGCFETEEKDGRACKERVLGVKHCINDHDEPTSAYLMDEFSDIEAITKFKIIADESDYVFVVCEHDKGGFMIEQGILVESADFRDYTYLLKREYSERKEEHDHYSWMQTKGVFQRFEYFGTLNTWTDPDDLQVLTGKLLNKLIPWPESEQ